jgi:hypothetical protein
MSRSVCWDSEVHIKDVVYLPYSRHLLGITKNQNHKKNLLKRRAVLLVNSGLAKVLGKPLSSIQMKWKQYVPEIVQPYGVGLVGWPTDIPFNPHALNISSLTALNNALSMDSGPPTCTWQRLSAEAIAAIVERDQAARAVNPPKPRKPRCDAGIPRKRRRGEEGDEAGNEEPDEDEDVEKQPEDDDEDEGGGGGGSNGSNTVE